jgi:hypothetical protein
LCGAPAAFAPICLIFKDKSIENFFVAFTLSRPVKGVDRRFAAEASERRRAEGANRRRGGNLPTHARRKKAFCFMFRLFCHILAAAGMLPVVKYKIV